MKRLRTQVWQARLLLLYALLGSAILSCVLAIVLVNVIKRRDTETLKQHRAAEARQFILLFEGLLHRRAPNAQDVREVSPHMLDYELRRQAYRVDVSRVCIFARDLSLAYASEGHAAHACSADQRPLRFALQNSTMEVLTPPDRNKSYFVKTFLPVHNEKREVIGAAEVWVDVTYVVSTFTSSINQTLVLLILLTLAFNFVLFGIGEALVRRMREAVAKQLHAEEQLERSQSLARIGLMVAGLSHQLRNPLSILSGIAASLNRRPALEEQRPFLRALTEETDRIKRLSEVFLDFAKPVRLNVQKCNVYELTQRVEGLLHNQAPAAQVEISGPNSLEFSLDGELIFQALVNITLNSVEAFGQGGKDKNPHINIDFSASNGVLFLQVVDNGTGFTPEQLDRLRGGPQPFYSTKVNGSGLGLAVADKIAAAHGGRIELANDATGGAKVRLSIPSQGITHE